VPDLLIPGVLRRDRRPGVRPRKWAPTLPALGATGDARGLHAGRAHPRGGRGLSPRPPGLPRRAVLLVAVRWPVRLPASVAEGRRGLLGCVSRGRRQDEGGSPVTEPTTPAHPDKPPTDRAEVAAPGAIVSFVDVFNAEELEDLRREHR